MHNNINHTLTSTYSSNLFMCKFSSQGILILQQFCTLQLLFLTSSIVNNFFHYIAIVCTVFCTISNITISNKQKKNITISYNHLLRNYLFECSSSTITSQQIIFFQYYYSNVCQNITNISITNTSVHKNLDNLVTSSTQINFYLK